MTRFVRMVWNAATMLSLMPCVWTVAAWVRSYEHRDDVWWALTKPRLHLGIGADRGEFFVAILIPFDGNRWFPPGAGWNPSTPMSYAKGLDQQGTFFNRFGFALNSFQIKVYAMRQFACPYWFTTLLTALLPGARLVAWRRRARRRHTDPGLCRHCGYDCRATSERCPECGAVPAAKELRPVEAGG